MTCLMSIQLLVMHDSALFWYAEIWGVIQHKCCEALRRA